MKIGELARQTDTAIETIRYYEREALLPQPPRTEANYRIYGSEHAQRLAFIRHCRSLDMTLQEIRLLLRFKDAPYEDCGEVNALLDEHVGHVAARIRALRDLQRQLRALRALCQEARNTAQCGILSGLAADAAVQARREKPLPGHVAGSHRVNAAKRMNTKEQAAGRTARAGLKR